MLKKLVSILLFFFTFAFSPAGYAQSDPAQKPLPPVSIRIQPVRPDITSDSIQPGDIVDLLVSAGSAVDVSEMKIEVELLGGAKRVAGATAWKGHAGKNETKTITLSVRAPETGTGRVRARVSMPSAKGRHFMAVTEFVLGPAAAAEDNGVSRKNSKGRPIIEYR